MCQTLGMWDKIVSFHGQGIYSLGLSHKFKYSIYTWYASKKYEGTPPQFAKKGNFTTTWSLGKGKC